MPKDGPSCSRDRRRAWRMDCVACRERVAMYRYRATLCIDFTDDKDDCDD